MNATRLNHLDKENRQVISFDIQVLKIGKRLLILMIYI